MTNTSKFENGRPVIHWVDFARFVGAFLVVMAHIQGWGEGPLWAQTFYYTISRVGVPIFFLISSYLLLSKEEEISVFFKKRAMRIAIPFLVWSILYDIQNAKPFLESGVTLDAFIGIFVRILRGPREGHLWFFYSLIGLYLLTPILRVFVSKAKPSEMVYYIALWFLVVPILYLLEGLTSLKNGFEIYHTGGYVGYFLLGYVLGRLEITPQIRRLALAVFIVSFLFSFSVFNFNLPPLDNELPFRSYPSLNIVLMSLAAFVLVKEIGERVSGTLNQVSVLVSHASFGIYLIHPMVLRWITLIWENFGFNPATGSSLIVIPVMTLVVFLLSWTITSILSRIPYIRAIV
jgi:surface polysaccharide O-acyltransferase-like enzyme